MTGGGALSLLLVAVAAAGGCARNSSGPGAGPPKVVEELRVKVVRALPHDRGAFTQGLEFFEGKLYESTGLRGQSSLRRVDPETGRVETQVALEAPLFAEGLTRVGGFLVQITWQEGRALVWNLSSFKKEREHTYDGEGWGLCHDGKRLVMSDGSDRLVFRDPQTFAKTGEVAVRRNGAPVTYLNELECADGLVYANVWQQSAIARIDPATGEVTGWIDASGLLTREEMAGVDVLNGIAHIPGSRRFMITGKLWPRIFEVELVSTGSPPASGTH